MAAPRRSWLLAIALLALTARMARAETVNGASCGRALLGGGGSRQRFADPLRRCAWVHRVLRARRRMWCLPSCTVCGERGA